MNSPAVACEDCRLPECICPATGPVPSSVEIVVVRHWVERHKVSGTARLIPLAVGGARIVDFGGPSPFDAREFTEAPIDTAILFPGGTELSDTSPLRRLIVPDGSWPQARRIRRSLARVSSVGLPAGPATLRLRDPRAPEELATAVAVARALELLGEAAPSALLETLYEAMHRLLTARDSRRTQEYQ